MQVQYPTVEIDNIGTFKYIQIKITKKSDVNDKKIIIRGTSQFKFHDQNFKQFMTVNNIGINDTYSYEPIGGGILTIDESNMKIYGMSSVYGACDHNLTKQILLDNLEGADKFNIVVEN